MSKGKYRRSSKTKSQIEWIIISCIALYAIGKILFGWLQRLKENFVLMIQSMSLVEWSLSVVFLASLAYLLHTLINLRKTKQAQYIRNQAKARVLRGSAYQKLMTMNSAEFEKYIADLFTCKGYTAELTPLTGDGGKDIILRKNKEVSVVECKRYSETNKISRPDIQKFHSALIDMNAKEGYFVTTGYFTEPAMKYCIDKPIKLIDLPRLMELIEETRVG
ncbi:restriction endonuclease [Bacillus sp. EB01]|uniref:restriction endonuclease n=1 Tax=Bacillus sp. EB01 TaxID=1347086 RepID=UPI00069498C1|nr:restriction endonuclease [Bacillus sp. EB01]